MIKKIYKAIEMNMQLFQNNVITTSGLEESDDLENLVDIGDFTTND